MDPNRFDTFTRSLGTARTRRGMMKMLGAAALGAAGLAGGGRGAGAAPAGKVGICHQTGSAKNPYNYLTVSQNAVRAHEAHGDAIGVDLLTDPEHCGGCGIVCPTPANSFARCSNGTCGFTCLEGFADCNNDPDDGCETYVAGNDLANCGDCDEICATTVNGATATCIDGGCDVSCASGEFCGEVCSDTSSDPTNCGECGNVCPGPTSGRGDAICSGGKCDISCGRSDIGFQLTRCNGACVDTRYPDNCGGCGNVCPDSCQCNQTFNGIFCYSGRSGSSSGCHHDDDCAVIGETCQGIGDSGFGTCTPINCRDNAGVCPEGSQCTANVGCEELCSAA